VVVAVAERPVVAPAQDAPPPPRGTRPTLRERIAALFVVPDPAERERLRRHRLDGARAMLERAQRLVTECWVQDAFYVVRDARGALRPVSPFGLLLTSRDDVAGACLVGAVAHASSSVDRRERRGPSATAVDMLWSELAERHPEAVTGPGVLPAWDDPHPGARAARVRDLARWNDDPRRTREDVLGLLDGAVSRTISAAVR
jgi:hypothetical protein